MSFDPHTGERVPGVTVPSGPVPVDGGRPGHPGGPGGVHPGGAGRPQQTPQYPQPQVPAPAQRQYAQPRLSPTVTQEMRIRAQVQPFGGSPVQDEWSTQAIVRMPRPDPTASGNTVRTVLIWGLIGILGLILVGALFLAGFFMSGGAPAIILSLFPLTWITLTVIWFDKWKPQPKALLIGCVLWGAVASVIATFALTAVLDGTLNALFGFGLSADPILGPVVSAPITEEITKGIFLVVIVLAARRWFEGPLDGWIYGTLIGAGFAFTENILYLTSSHAQGAEMGQGTQALLVTWVMRCVFSPLLHSAFVACAGVTIGLAARRGRWWATVLMWLPGLFLGMIVHGLWNGVATWSSSTENILIIIGTAILLSLLLSGTWFVVGLVLRHNEAQHTRQMLGDYANAGWMTHSEVDMLGTWRGRRAGKRWAKQYPGAKQAMNQLIRTAALLATTRERVLAGVGGDKEREVETYHLEALTKQRTLLMYKVNKAIHGFGGPGGGMQRGPGAGGPGGTPGGPQHPGGPGFRQGPPAPGPGMPPMQGRPGSQYPQPGYPQPGAPQYRGGRPPGY